MKRKVRLPADPSGREMQRQRANRFVDPLFDLNMEGTMKPIPCDQRSSRSECCHRLKTNQVVWNSRGETGRSTQATNRLVDVIAVELPRIRAVISGARAIIPASLFARIVMKQGTATTMLSAAEDVGRIRHILCSEGDHVTVAVFSSNGPRAQEFNPWLELLLVLLCMSVIRLPRMISMKSFFCLAIGGCSTMIE